MNQIPASFYVIVGVLIIGNLSVIVTMMTFIFKAGGFVAETKAGIKHSQETANRAHKRIDELNELVQ